MGENEPRDAPVVRPHRAMTVHCPHCSTGYLLPDHLVGPRGARVRCPGCQGAFVVLREGGPCGAALGAARSRDSSSAPASRSDLRGPHAPGAAVIAAAAPERTSSAGSPAAGTPGPAPEASAVAAAILDALAARLGEALAQASARGRVFSEHGPAVVAAFDEYRRRAGAGASAVVFRAALKERCGVDLTPSHER